MRTGYYVHIFLYPPRESGSHIPTNSIEDVYARVFVIQIYILITYWKRQDVKLTIETVDAVWQGALFVLLYSIRIRS